MLSTFLFKSRQITAPLIMKRAHEQCYNGLYSESLPKPEQTPVPEPTRIQQFWNPNSKGC